MTRSGKRSSRSKKAEPESREDNVEYLEKTPAEKRREEFGEWVSFRRKQLRNPRLSQAEAAKTAEISRETWNRIERGKQLPDPANIPAIAEILKVSVERLFRRAGYEVPLDLQIDSRKKLTRDLLATWDESSSTAQFMFGVLGIWIRDKPQDEKWRRIYLDVGFAQILQAIQENLLRPQQLRLAAELIQQSPVTVLRKERIDAGKLLEEIDSELERIKRIEARSLGGLYEIRSLDDMGQYNLVITDDDLTDFLTLLGSRTKGGS
jgi:DNA-binding XRE family transcriptional regulator